MGLQRDSPTRAPPPRSIRYYFAVVVLVATLPLCVYIALILQRESEAAIESAKTVATSTANAAAQRIRNRAEQTELLAKQLAERPLVRELDPGRCDPLLRSLLDVFPDYANISTMSPERRFVCSARPLPRPDVVSPLHEGIRAALEGQFGISLPLVGVVPARLMVSAAYPIRDREGGIRGVLTIPIDLASLRPVEAKRDLPQGSVVYIVNPDGVLVASSETPDARLGTSLRDLPLIGQAMSHGHGSAIAAGADGVERVFAYVPVMAQGWIALAGIPAAEYRRAAVQNSTVAGALAIAAVAVALLTAAGISRRVTRPVDDLSRVMDEIAGGGTRRASEAGPVEVGTLARHFNEMVDELARRKLALTRSEEELKKLSERLIEVEETERRNINREVHDGIGQNLALMNLGLQGLLRGGGAASPEASDKIADLQKLAATTMQQARDVMANLRPPGLDDHGLRAALANHVEQLRNRTGASIVLSGRDVDRRFPIAHEVAVFRIAQEALINATKHAGAGLIEVSVQESGDAVVVVVRDNGRGFEPSETGTRLSWGQQTMRERAAAIGARLEIESWPGFGTKVTITMKPA